MKGRIKGRITTSKTAFIAAESYCNIQVISTIERADKRADKRAGIA